MKYNIKNKIIRYKIAEKHIECTRSGKYRVAKNLLYLLRRNIISLGCSETDWETEEILYEIGLKPIYSRNYNTATFRI